MREIELKDTVDYMLSVKYKDRLVAEFWQNMIRYRKCCQALRIWDRPTVVVPAGTGRKLIERQAELLAGYLFILMKRAIIENIDLFPLDLTTEPGVKEPIRSASTKEPPYKDPSDPLFRRDTFDTGRGTHA